MFPLNVRLVGEAETGSLTVSPVEPECPLLSVNVSVVEPAFAPVAVAVAFSVAVPEPVSPDIAIMDASKPVGPLLRTEPEKLVVALIALLLPVPQRLIVAGVAVTITEFAATAFTPGRNTSMIAKVAATVFLQGMCSVLSECALSLHRR